MHTPEPRRARASGGGAESVTPQVDSTAVTPTPRAGYLRRGETASLHGTIAAGPSVLFDEEAGTAVALDVSPQPSQLTQQTLLTASSSQFGLGQTRLPRQRPRFHTVQDLDVALNQAIEGKITSRNAWASKEASDLLEGITHTIETTLDAASADDYAGFAKAATVVEGCSKVWTSRVDSTYQQSNQMVQRLLRKDDAPSRGPGDGDAEGGEDGEPNEENELSQRNKSRSRTAAAAAAAAARTLALDATEINLDSKSRTALTQTGVNAQFRAITSKFDQGNAQGLLMNNAPIGRAGNIILDVDYSLLPPSAMAAGRVSGGRGSGRRGSAHAAATAGAEVGTDATGNEASGNTAVGAEAAAASRTSQHLGVEHDTAVYDTVRDFPPYAGAAGGSASPGQPSSARASLAFSQRGGNSSGTGDGGGDVDGLFASRGSQASLIDPLLMLTHTSAVTSPTADVNGQQQQQRFSLLKSEAAGMADGTLGYGDEEGFPGEDRKSAIRNDLRQVGGEEDDDTGGGYGDDDWGAGADDDDNYYGERDPDAATQGALATGITAGATEADSVGGVRDLGLEARHLVSGFTEMEAMDTLFHGHTQLALEAEDPTSWCPLSEVSKNPLAGGLGRSELSRLHREHRFTPSQSQRQAGLDSTLGAGAGSGSGAFAAKPESPTGPAAKRGRKERTVVFQLPDGHTSSPLTAATFSVKTESTEDATLKQATTAARNITPLGKQLLLAKDAAHAVVAFTQSAVQRSKAEQAGLVLAEAPIPGKTIPSYMPYPIHTQDYFQPFSTALTQWNLLRKSATGRLIDSSSSHTVNDATPSAAAPRHRLGEYGGDEDDDSVPLGADGGAREAGARHREADMPVEFFPGGAEVEGDDGAETGGDYADYADYADLYGPDDDDEAERRYVEGGLGSSSDARLVAQVEMAAAAAASLHHSGSSASSSPRTSAGDSAAGLVSSDPMELLKVLSSPEATIPNQVDVVRLRQLMWEALQGHLSANQQSTAVDLASLRQTALSEKNGRRKAAPVTAKTAVKAHAQAVLDRIRKRARAAEENEAEKKNKGSSSSSDDDDDDSDEEEEEEKIAQGKNYEAGKSSAAGKSGDPFLQLSEAAKPEPTEIPLTKFSDVVRSVLPHISSVSSTNTLSPAFFFFSILFLANEHNVVLQNVDTLDDLNACGIARRVGE